MVQGRLNIAFVALTVALGGFLLGFDATVISGVVPFIREYFALSGVSGDLKLGFAVSSLGGALGPAGLTRDPAPLGVEHPLFWSLRTLG